MTSPQTNSRPKDNVWKALPYVSAALYLVSLLTPALITQASINEPWPGWSLLAFGWLALIDGHVSWLANPLFLFALLAYSRKSFGRAFLFAALASILMLSFLLYKSILADEGGGRTQIIGHPIGYWAWVASALVLMVSAAVALIVTREGMVPAEAVEPRDGGA
jgi:hypothetical protein